MSARKRGLGKGLDALLGAGQPGRTESDNAAEPAAGSVGGRRWVGARFRSGST